MSGDRFTGRMLGSFWKVIDRLESDGPTAPPEPVVMGPDAQCGVPVTPSCERKVGDRGLMLL